MTRLDGARECVAPDVSGEQGSTTLWILALSLALLMVGGIGVDLWRALAEYRELAGIADAAAVAASSAVDADHFRATGQVVLDEDLAHRLALAQIAAQPDEVTLSAPPDVDIDDGLTVTVVLQRSFRLTLLALAAPGEEIQIRAEARADASLRP
jgi:Flp pilus assembly protein TadG